MAKPPIFRVHLRITLCLVLAGLTAQAQDGGRFEAAKRQAIAYLESNQYDKAAGKLEGIWEEQQTDPWVAEQLAIACLNGNERAYRPELAKMARELMEKALALGGSASFLVQHSHDRFALGALNNYCAGTLSVGRGKLVFIVRTGKGTQDHSFALTGEQVTVSGADSVGAVHIKTKVRNYLFLTRSRKKGDGDMMSSLIQQQLPSILSQKGKQP